jgi:hypothetical protein
MDKGAGVRDRCAVHIGPLENQVWASGFCRLIALDRGKDAESTL